MLENPEIVDDYLFDVALYRYMTPRDQGQPTLHEIAIQAWIPTEAEQAFGLQDRSIFEQFWCYSLYNQGIDCFEDDDTMSGFWKNAYEAVSNYFGNDY